MQRIEYRAIRDSHALGLYKGMRAYVVRGSTRNGRMDLDVPELGTRIVRVDLMHPDIVPVG